MDDGSTQPTGFDFVKKPVPGSELHGVHKLIWGYGGGAKISAGVKPWRQIEPYLLLRLIIVKMLLLIMHSTINLFSCLHMWDAN